MNDHTDLTQLLESSIPAFRASANAALREAAEEDVDYGDFWADHLSGKGLSEQARAMCEAIAMGQDDATIARMARELRELAIEEQLEA